MRNVHEFDGKLKSIYTGPMYSTDEKREALQSFSTKLTSQPAINTIKTMLADLNSSSGSNYHEENDVDSTDILTDIITRGEYPLDVLQEQLTDTSLLGLCDSGRVTRVLQVWLACEREERG